MNITKMTYPATPSLPRAMAFTTFGAGQESAWGQPLRPRTGVVRVPNQHGGADLQQTTVIGNNRSAAKPGSPPRREPR